MIQRPAFRTSFFLVITPGQSRHLGFVFKMPREGREENIFFRHGYATLLLMVQTMADSRRSANSIRVLTVPNGK